MQFTSTLILALATAAAASPVQSVRRQDAVTGAINQWLSDIQVVNNFLNLIQFSSTPSADAAALLPSAADEPNQLNILAPLVNDASGHQNAANLMANFPTVPAAIKNIINANDDPNIVRANVAVINSIRCGTVLQNIGGLWGSAVFDNGLAAVAFPPGPNVCPTADGNGVYAVVAPLLN